MKRTRDPDRTRRSILDAAATEICAYGPAGARIDAIAEAAGINKRMLYHYFGSKDGLLAAVFEDRLGAPGDDGQTSLSAALMARQRRSAEQPDEIRLLMWQALADAGGRAAGQSERAEASRKRIEPVGAARRGGSSDLDAAQRELTFAAIAMFPFAFPQLTRQITGQSPTDPFFLAARAEHLAALAALLETERGEMKISEPERAESKPSGLPKPSESAADAKPRFRLTANVTESPRTAAPGQREMDAKTSK